MLGMEQPSLPAGWVEGYDDNYGRPYYFHKPSRRSSWTKPMFEELGEEEHEGETSSLNSSSFNRSQLSLSSASPSRAHPQQHALNRFDDWLEIYSPEFQRSFFYNKITKESVWHDPRQQQQQQRWNSPNRSFDFEGKASLLQQDRTPAALLSVWENVGNSPSKNNNNTGNGMMDEDEKLRVTPIASRQHLNNNDSTGAVPTTNHILPPSSSTTTATANNTTTTTDNNNNTQPLQPSPVLIQPPTQTPPPVPLRQQYKEQQRQKITTQDSLFHSSDNELGQQLHQFTQELQDQGNTVLKYSSAFEGQDKDELGEFEDELRRTAEAVANSNPVGKDKYKRKGMKRAFEGENLFALASWGNEPPKVLEVKKAMKSVQDGIKYAQEELKAHGEAAREAAQMDVEGGFYTILGIPTNATPGEIKKAFKRAMIKNHPDKVPPAQRDEAMKKSDMIQNANNCLSDPWERFCYDYFGLKRYLQNQKIVQCFRNYMLSGVDILKHPRKTYSYWKAKPLKRKFWISPDFEWLMTGKERILEPDAMERQELKGVRIADIHDITKGIATEVFETTGKPKKQSRYFSIITNERTLDLEAESKDRADFFFARISLLVIDTQQSRKWLQRYFELKALKDASAIQKNSRGFQPQPPPNTPPSQQNQQNQDFQEGQQQQQQQEHREQAPQSESNTREGGGGGGNE